MEFELENKKEDNEGDIGGGSGNINMNQHAQDILSSRRDGNMDYMKSRRLMDS